MRQNKTRTSDSTFDLNLAPVLDIIVSIIPMLLLSVAFVQIKMIEAPTPQVVSEKNVTQPPQPEVQVELKVSNAGGFLFQVTDLKGKTTVTNISLLSGQFNYEGLLDSAIKIKEMHPGVTSIQLNPDSDVSFDNIVKIIDQVREKPRIQQKLSVTDSVNSKPTETQYLFPDIIFASVGG